MRRCRFVFLALFMAIALMACAGEKTISTAQVDADAASRLGLTADEVASLASLEQVDAYPLYTMHHYAPAPLIGAAAASPTADAAGGPAWGCSLFAALADPEEQVFGRNFDWTFSPALLLFNHPEDGYTSAAMVDIEYLGYAGDESERLTDRPVDELLGLLDASRLPFDGMNEKGLVVGMAAVPRAFVPADPTKDTVDSLGIIRLALDGAATVTEAVDIMRSHNVDFEGQTPLHYLLADATGDSALVEYHEGAIEVIRSGTGWHQMTNFVQSAVDDTAGHCDRYDAITEELEASGGALDPAGAMALLGRVAQSSTQWSMVYDLTTGEMSVVMGQDYDRTHSFSFDGAG